MEEIEKLDKVINDISEIRKKAEKLGAINLREMLKGVKNPASLDKKIIQKLLDLRDEITLTLKPLGQVRDKAVNERIKIEQRGPLSE